MYLVMVYVGYWNKGLYTFYTCLLFIGCFSCLLLFLAVVTLFDLFFHSFPEWVRNWTIVVIWSLLGSKEEYDY